MISCRLPEPTAYTPMLIKYALELLSKIYREGYAYKKAGVALMNLVPASEAQQNLFVRFDSPKHRRLMETMDRINGQWGRETVRSGASGYERVWGMRRVRVSNRFTTN